MNAATPLGAWGCSVISLGTPVADVVTMAATPPDGRGRNSTPTAARAVVDRTNASTTMATSSMAAATAGTVDTGGLLFLSLKE